MKAGCDRCQGNTRGIRRRCIHCNRQLCSTCKPWKEWCVDCAPRHKVGDIVRLRVGSSKELTEEYGEIIARLDGGAALVQWAERERPYTHLESSLVRV